MNTRVQNPYIYAIEMSGGIPILLPYTRECKTVEHLVDICDGFFFTGGVDIDPKRYGEDARENVRYIQEYRDEFEYRVFQKVIKTSKPIFAICRGDQFVNIAFGGTLYQDIPSKVQTKISHRQNEPEFSPSHGVRIIADTPMHKMMRFIQ